MLDINMKEFNTWIKALRSGKYKQTKYALQDPNGYCCLGVACEVLPFKKIFEDSYLFGSLPPAQSEAPKWLQYINGDFYVKTSIMLHDLNDKENFTFDEIADVLEAVYIHKVLEE